MSSVLKKIFKKEAEENDEEIHSDFIKYSRGLFENKYLIEGKKQKVAWSIKTSYEFANFFVRRCLSGVSGPIKVKGAIISTSDLREEIDFEIERVKQFMGVKQLLVDTEVDPEKIIELMDKYPRVFFALTFSTDKNQLKVKARAPKSAKPSNKEGGEPKADFCALKTTDESIIRDLFFDQSDFKEIRVKHNIEIKNIEIPKGEEDPVTIRENSKRHGTIKRIMNVDGSDKISEADFVA
jgi:hypothetical protein